VAVVETLRSQQSLAYNKVRVPGLPATSEPRGFSQDRSELAHCMRRLVGCPWKVPRNNFGCEFMHGRTGE
jgi:hypothetical protein